MGFKTADLRDKFEALVQVAEPIFEDYGGATSFYGQIATVQVFEDNVLVREALEMGGRQRVLVVDDEASTRCALVGDRRLAQLAYDNDWTGLVVNACIRERAETAEISLGVKALHAIPKKSGKEGTGELDVPVHFAGLAFTPGQYLYADSDRIIVSSREL
jgi:regulator of ribonuclease activity A